MRKGEDVKLTGEPGLSTVIYSEVSGLLDE